MSPTATEFGRDEFFRTERDQGSESHVDPRPTPTRESKGPGDSDNSSKEGPTVRGPQESPRGRGGVKTGLGDGTPKEKTHWVQDRRKFRDSKESVVESGRSDSGSRGPTRDLRDRTSASLVCSNIFPSPPPRATPRSGALGRVWRFTRPV